MLVKYKINSYLRKIYSYKKSQYKKLQYDNGRAHFLWFNWRTTAVYLDENISNWQNVHKVNQLQKMQVLFLICSNNLKYTYTILLRNEKCMKEG